MGTSLKTESFLAQLTKKLVPNRDSSILELSCGRGHLLTMLKKDGYNVQGTNYSIYEDTDSNLDIIQGIDVTKGGGFIEKKYDCVILSETIQNISDHYNVYKTMYELLKDNGYAIISTPNIMNIRSRLHFLFTGFFRVKWNFIGFDVPYEESFCYHNHPIHLPVDMYYVYVSGFSIEDIDGITVKNRNILFFVLFYIPIIIFTWFNIHHSEPFLLNTVFGKQIFKFLTSYKALNSERMVLILKKNLNNRENTDKRITPHITWYKK